MNIIDALHSKDYFKPLFPDLSTWHSWEVFLKALFGLPIDVVKDGLFFREVTGLEYVPKEKYREAYVIAGRRSGKSRISSIIAVWLATYRDWTKFLAPGERGYIFIIAVDKAQAKIIKDYISEALNSGPGFKKLIKKDLTWEIELNNQVTISVKYGSFRSVRGYTLIAAILEELAFWRSEEFANPDREVINAIRPALATIPDSLLIGISTPHSRRGVLFEQWRKWYGVPGGPLLLKAPTERLNPAINKKLIEQSFKDDPQFALSEWQAEWRKDVEAFLPEEAIEAVIIPKRYELPPLQGFSYYGFCDPSGGRQDSMTLAISHNDKGRVIIDLIKEVKPPFSPEVVVKDFSETLKRYGISEIFADKYAGAWVQESFLKNDIILNPCEKSKSELYLNFLPMVQNQSVELLDNQKLKVQLASLERRTRIGGKDSVDVFFGHDDLANAAAGACFLAGEEKIERDVIVVNIGPQGIEDWEKQMIAKTVPPLKEPEKEDPEIARLSTKANALKYLELSRQGLNSVEIAKEMKISDSLLRAWITLKREFIQNAAVEAGELSASSDDEFFTEIG